MSLQCEGDGAVCSACGHFDFLPLMCARCHGNFCSEHIEHHLVASTQVVCAAPDVDNTLVVQTSYPSGVALERCALCGTECHVIIPCFTCQRSFCTAHRFHVHDGGTEKRRTEGKQHSFITTPSGVVEDFAHLCARYSPTAPLRLSPPTHRGRTIPVTVMLCAENSGPDPDDGASYSLGVLPIHVAAEMSVGQLVDRLKGAHPMLLSSSLNQPLYHVEGADRVILRVIPLSVTVGEASLANRVAALLLPQAHNAENDISGRGAHQNEREFSTTALESILTERLFGPIPRGTRRDTRLHAAATSIRFWSRQHEATGSPYATREENEEREVAVAEMTETGDLHPPPRGFHLPCRLSASECVEPEIALAGEQHPPEGTAPWPFRSPSTLDSICFSHTRMNPHGLEACRRRGAGASPIIVAVFVADRLASRALPPFCIALPTEWSLGRIFDHIVQFVDESVAFQGQVRWQMFDMRTQVSLTAGDLTQKNSLRDGDVLFLDEQFPEVLRAEVMRLQQMKGKEGAALKMKTMKTCNVM